MADAHANFAVSSVATAPSPATSGTSLVVASGEGARFPAVPFNAVIAPASATPTPANAEVVRVTARSTDTLTITRAQESSTARTVIVGDRIYAGLTVKGLTDIENAVIAREDGLAGTKISAMTELTAPDVLDELVIVDKSDTSQAASGTTKRIKQQTLPSNWWATPQGITFPLTSAPASTATGSINQWYAARVILLGGTSAVTGIRYRVGATSNGNVRSSLWTIDGGTQLANRTTDVVQGTANQNQQVAFDSTYAAAPGIYIALLWFSSATATFFGARQLTSTQNGTNATTTPTSAIGAGSVENADRPIMVTY